MKIEIGGIYKLKLAMGRVMVLRRGYEMVNEIQGSPRPVEVYLVRRGTSFNKIWVHPFELEEDV